MSRKKGTKKQQPVADQKPESTEEESRRPECYGTFEPVPACLKECSMLDSCRRLKGKLNSPTRGLSRKRSDRAFCFSCNGGSLRLGCIDPVCPKYAFLPKSKQEAGPPDLWWTQPSSKWDELEQAARKVKREISEPKDQEEEDGDADQG